MLWCDLARETEDTDFIKTDVVRPPANPNFWRWEIQQVSKLILLEYVGVI